MSQPTHYYIQTKQLLTMPLHPKSLEDYDPSIDLRDRDVKLTGLIEDAAVMVKDGVIKWVGPYHQLSKHCNPNDLPHFEAPLVMPGFIDCHTHAVFAGDRSQEFVLRNAGRPYLEILEAGGGILNTVDLVRRTSTSDLEKNLISAVYDAVRHGVTTMEVKSGYGLTTSDERKLLRATKRAQDSVPCELVSCFLGAHAIPHTHRDNPDGYVDLICHEMIPMVAEEKLSSYCDVFCDKGAFSYDQARRVLEKGKAYGLTPRIHADELTDAGAARLAVEVGACCADHLEHTPHEIFPLMAKANVTPVIMPAVNLFLGTTDHVADARAMIAAGCDVAVASDFNPGSAMTQDMQLVTTLACTLHKLTPGEALRGITVAAAKALNRDDIGRIAPGLRANLTILDVPDFYTIPYHFGKNHITGVILNGEIVFFSEVDRIEEDLQ